MRPLLGLVCLALAAGCSPKKASDFERLGGIRVVYAVDRPDATADQLKVRDEIIDEVRDRLDNHGYDKSEVIPLDSERFQIQVAGDTDLARLRSNLETVHHLGLYHAKNLGTTDHPDRIYIDKPGSDPNNPVVEFVRNASGKVIGPGTPEYAAIIKGWGSPVLDGKDILEVNTRPSGVDSYIPTMTFKQSGARKADAWSTKYYNTGEKLAWVIDGKVLNVAPLAPGVRIVDQVEISGTFTPKYVQELRNEMNEARVELNLKEVSADVVKPGAPPR